MKNSDHKMTSCGSMPIQAQPVERNMLSEKPIYPKFFAGGYLNFIQAFQEVEHCGCHLLSRISRGNCIASCIG